MAERITAASDADTGEAARWQQLSRVTGIAGLGCFARVDEPGLAAPVRVLLALADHPLRPAAAPRAGAEDVTGSQRIDPGSRP